MGLNTRKTEVFSNVGLNGSGGEVLGSAELLTLLWSGHWPVHNVIALVVGVVASTPIKSLLFWTL